MAQISGGHDYYKKILALQEKLRKSEEERIRLEERFQVLVQESRNRHDGCIKRLRLRYIDFLEEQRARDQRNHKLLGTLERVDSSLALMTAKTDRLNFLRNQYDASLMRAYANRNLPGSTTGDSGIASQNEDRWLRRNISQVHWISPEAKIFSSSMMRIDHPTQQSVSSIKLNSSTDRPFVSASPLITQSVSVLQTSPGRNGVSHPTSVAVHKNRKYLFSQDPSSRAYPSPYARHVRAEANENQHGPSGAVSTMEASSLCHQSVPRNVSQSVQMEPVQTAPCFLPFEIANANVSQYKLPTASPSVLPACSSSIAQSLQFPSRTVVPHPLQGSSNNGPSGFHLTSQTPLNAFPIQGAYREGPRDIRRSFRELGVHSVTNAEIDEIMRRDDPQPRKPIVSRSLHGFQSISGGNGDEAAANLDNQLDRYINKIQMSQREHDIRSFEEPDHEQNTSGDLLNVSLSDDDLDLPAEAKPTEQLPEKVERMLTLTDDLACRTLVDDAARMYGKGGAKMKCPVQTRYEEPVGDRSDKRGPAGTEDAAKAINEKTVVHLPELDIEQSATQGSLGLDSVGLANEQVDDSAFREIQGERQSSRKEGESFSPRVIGQKIEVGGNIHSGEEAELKLQSIEDLVELAVWDLKRVEKSVEDIDLYDIDKDQSTEKDAVTEESSAQDSSGKQLGVLDLLDSVPTKLEEKNIKVQLGDQSSKKPAKETDTAEVVNIRKGADDEPKLENGKEEHKDPQKELKSNESKDATITDDNKYEIQRDNESEPNQLKVQNNEQQENDNANQEEHTKVPNESQEYQQDYYGNVDYQNNVDQTYQEYVNQQYVEEAKEQFGEYPNQQYDQYEQDPNQEYREYSYDQQYDPNLTYEDQNQAYEYSGDVTYDVSVENTGDIGEENDARNQQEDKTLPELVEGEEKNDEEVCEADEPNVDNEQSEIHEQIQEASAPKKKDVIKSLLDSDTDSTLEKHVTTTESDFDFN